MKLKDLALTQLEQIVATAITNATNTPTSISISSLQMTTTPQQKFLDEESAAIQLTIIFGPQIGEVHKAHK